MCLVESQYSRAEVLTRAISIFQSHLRDLRCFLQLLTSSCRDEGQEYRIGCDFSAQRVVKSSRGNWWLSISRVSFRKLPCFFSSISLFLSSPLCVWHPRASGHGEDRYDIVDLSRSPGWSISRSPPGFWDWFNFGYVDRPASEFIQRPFALLIFLYTACDTDFWIASKLIFSRKIA